MYCSLYQIVSVARPPINHELRGEAALYFFVSFVNFVVKHFSSIFVFSVNFVVNHVRALSA